MSLATKGGAHLQDRNEVEDPRSGLRTDLAGLRGSDAHPAPRVPGPTPPRQRRQSVSTANLEKIDGDGRSSAPLLAGAMSK